MDFQFDATADGRRLRFFNVIDEHSRPLPPLSGHPSQQALQGQGRRVRAGGAHEPLPGACVHP